MLRLIDAGASKNELMRIEQNDNGGIDVYITGLDMAIKLLDKQSTIDTVPVVRCKDCRHSHKINDVLDFDGESSLYECSYATVPNRGWEFCSWGERREEK